MDDLEQEFLEKVLTLRATRGADRLGREWASKSAPQFAAYVRSMLKNLAVDGNPWWDVQRALREVVKAAVSNGLPRPNGMPASVERASRFARTLIAEACAELVDRGVEASGAALTSALMREYGFGLKSASQAEVADLTSHAITPLDRLDASRTSAAVVETFLHEAGPDGKELLALRPLGLAAMAKRLGLALSTTHERYVRVEATLMRIARRLGADRGAVKSALQQLTLA